MLREQPAFVYWGATVAALLVKMHLVSLAQLVHRLRTQNWRVPEDARLFGRAGATADPPEGLGRRADNAWRNDLENIPGFLLLGLVFVLAGGPAGWAATWFGTFTVARVAHTIAYLAARQPYRTIAFQVGMLAMTGLLIHVVLLLAG